MKITVGSELTGNDVLCVGVWEEGRSEMPSSLAQDVENAIKSGAFKKNFGEIYITKQTGFFRAIVIGLGKKKEMSVERLRRILGKCVKTTKTLHQKSFTTTIPLEAHKVLKNNRLVARASSEGLVLANYIFTKYLDKEKKEKKQPLSKVHIQWDKKDKSFIQGLGEGKIIAQSANFVKDLVNEPSGVATSVYMEKMAKKVASSSSRIKLKTLNKPQLQKLGMGALLGVNAGSNKPPKLLFVEYRGGKSNEPWVAIVGKGITFDSGGYNIKPTGYMEDMKIDMAGSAAALGTIKAANDLGISQNIVGVLALCENMVSSSAQHPGDIVRAYNGKTIEIGNTDAEGRLVLADALAYTQDRYKPNVMVDMATLTGACVVALGLFTAAVMGPDSELNNALQEAGMQSGDKIWELPFFEEYQNSMDGSISDLNNICPKGRNFGAGSITAGVFLSKFVDTKKTAWAHLDIAGSAYWTDAGDYTAKGATGSGVRALSYWLLNK